MSDVQYTEYDIIYKVAVDGDQGTGKTTFAALFAEEICPNVPVLWFNLEPIGNLRSILQQYPGLDERVTILPTVDDFDEIAEKAYKRDPNEYDEAYDLELAYYIVDKTIEYGRARKEKLGNSLVVFDTASLVYQKLVWNIMEQRKKPGNEAMMREGAMAYGPAKRKFTRMIQRTSFWPNNVIWLGRVKPGGEEYINPNTGKKAFRFIDGKEDSEWKNILDYYATIIIRLVKKKEYMTNEKNELVPGADGKPTPIYVRYGTITKHKSGREGVPTIRNITPTKMMQWLNGEI